MSDWFIYLNVFKESAMKFSAAVCLFSSAGFCLFDFLFVRLHFFLAHYVCLSVSV